MKTEKEITTCSYCGSSYQFQTPEGLWRCSYCRQLILEKDDCKSFHKGLGKKPMKTEKEIKEMLLEVDEKFDYEAVTYWGQPDSSEAMGRNEGKVLALKWVLGQEIYLKKLCDEGIKE